MKRKTFIKRSGALLAGGMVSPLLSCQSSSSSSTPKEMRTNWAGNYTYKAPNYHIPENVEAAQKLVKELNQQKALGSTHCFNNIADSPGNQISTQKLSGIIGIDEENMILTVGAGTKYGQFAPEIHSKGFAVHNLASLPHISVAGACSTATHGSGVENGNLATAVVGLELITPSGELITLSKEKDGDTFNGVVVGLGALGIITKVSLAIEPTFEVRQDLFQNLPLQSLKDHFEEIMSAGYSVSLFTDWMNDEVSQIWVKRRTDREVADLGNDFFGATAATRNLHPIVALSAEHCTEQLGNPGPWFERLPHFKMGFTPSSGEELQSEFFVPFENGLEAILALEKKKELIFPELLISEIRTVAADELWMSPCYKQKSLVIHFTWKQKPKAVNKLITMIEAELAPFGVKPHWGKLFSVDPKTLQSRYERYDDFVALVKEFDPVGKYRNAWLDRNM